MDDPFMFSLHIGVDIHMLQAMPRLGALERIMNLSDFTLVDDTQPVRICGTCDVKFLGSQYWKVTWIEGRRPVVDTLTETYYCSRKCMNIAKWKDKK